MLSNETRRAGRRFGAPLAMAAVALLLFAIPSWGELLQLDRGRVAAGELWLLVTGHFTHWGTDHLVWDLVAFLALGAFCAARSRRRFLACCGVSALAISVGFLAFENELATYRGLSGIDSALFGLAMVELLRVGRRSERGSLVALGALGLMAFAAKSAFELATGHTAFVDSDSAGFIPVASAHLLGLASGIAVGLPTFSSRDRSEKPTLGLTRLGELS